MLYEVFINESISLETAWEDLYSKHFRKSLSCSVVWFTLTSLVTRLRILKFLTKSFAFCLEICSSFIHVSKDLMEFISLFDFSSLEAVFATWKIRDIETQLMMSNFKWLLVWVNICIHNTLSFYRHTTCLYLIIGSSKGNFLNWFLDHLVWLGTYVTHTIWRAISLSWSPNLFHKVTFI